MAEHRYMGTHADEVAVGDKKVPVGPGDFVDLSADDLKHDDNARLFDDGLLVDTSSFKNTTTAPLNKSLGTE